MRKFLALGGSKKLNTIKQQLNDSDIDIAVSQFTDTEIFIEKNKVEVKVSGKNILEFDYVWLTSSWNHRHLAYAVSLFLERAAISRFSPVEEEKSKLVDMILFALQGINLPKTYFGSTQNLKQRLSSIVEFCRYPFIIKPIRGLKGQGMFLVRSEAEFNSVISKLDERQHYICQKFIPNNFDYRIIIAGGKVASVAKRVRRSDDFRNNCFLGAEEFFLQRDTLPQSISEIAQQSTTALGLNWSGVDIVTSEKTGRSYIIELNRSPGFTLGSTEMSAAFDHILGLR